MHKSQELVRGFDDTFLAPHSRYTGVDYSAVRNNPELVVLADSVLCGPYIIVGQGGKHIFITGHPEYDALTLDQEYHRDLGKGISPDVPVNYYPDDDPNRTPVKSWRCHANTLYTNWLNYYVYQSTPYDWVNRDSDNNEDNN
jgi:homoserine O-succinyltransferase